jgi:hypothetical protein
MLPPGWKTQVNSVGCYQETSVSEQRFLRLAPFIRRMSDNLGKNIFA